MVKTGRLCGAAIRPSLGDEKVCACELKVPMLKVHRCS
jgi:hypothetical protein